MRCIPYFWLLGCFNICNGDVSFRFNITRNDGVFHLFPEENDIFANTHSIGFAQGVINACDDLIENLVKKYGEQYRLTIFTNAWYDLPDDGEAVKTRLLNAIVHQRDFTMAFTGISNTAGHDNLENQSYPIVFGEIMQPIFKLAGISLKVLNGAMGNTDFLPYSWCVEAHAGSHPDIVSWEMSMQVGSIPCEKTAAMVEAWIRTAVSLPSHPIPLLLNCQAEQKSCAKHDGVRPSHRHSVFEKVIGRCGGKKSTQEEASHDLSLWYQNFGIHSLNLEDLIIRFGCNDQLFSKNVLYGGKVGTPTTKSWHPGPKGHLLMAEVLAANYAVLLKQSLISLDKIAPGMMMEKLEDVKFRNHLLKKLNMVSSPLEQEPLPEPSFCSLEQCQQAGRYNCLTSFYPNWEEHLNISHYVISSNFNPVPKFQYLPSNANNWEVLVNEPLRAIEGFHYFDPTWPIDRKWVIAGTAEAGPLELKFETLQLQSGETGAVMICRPLPAEGTSQEHRAQSSSKLQIRIFLDSEMVSASRIGSQSGSSICWTLSKRIENGEHVLKIEAISNSFAGLVRISHLIVPK